MSSNGTPTTNTGQLPRGVLGRSGTPFPPGARLPSIRTPRDLTLTGGQKRTFTPNVAASRRTPNKDGNSTPSPVPSKQGGRSGRGGRGGQKGGRGRGRGANLVQLQGGAFADGLADAEKGKGGSRNVYMLGSAGSAPERPKYVPTTATEKEEDEERLKQLLCDDFIEDGDMESNRLNPVALPLSTIKSDGGIKEEEVRLGDGIKAIKREQGEEEDKKPSLEKCTNTVASITTKVVRRVPVSELCIDTNLPEVGKLLFFQFPDSLPGLVASSDSLNSVNVKKESRTEGASTSVKPEPGAKPEKPEVRTFKLGDFPEGYVGKVQVMKSGRTKLLLGSVALDIEMGTLVSFHQDAVSLRMLEGGEGDVTVLGQVPHKLICLPDVENLLASCSK